MFKKIIFGLLILSTYMSFGQQQIDLTLKYNSGLNRYEVYARPNFTQNNFTWGPSQISVVTPNSLADNPLTITSFNAGNWGDNSTIYSPAAQTQNDFHGVESGGSLTNLVSGVETLIFSFVLPDNCVNGLRLFNNGIDPNSAAAGMFGGDFSNTIDNGMITDVYHINYNNNGTRCIDAVDDSPNPIVGLTGATGVVNVLTNDTLGGNPVNPTDVVLTELNPSTTDPLTLNPNGTVDVAPNTPAGTYTLTYQICEVVNPTNCDTAIVTIIVTAAPIIANDDTPINPINGLTGQNNVINIYTNDTLNGVSFVPAAVNYTVVTPFSNPNITVATNGNVNVAPNTPAGTYTSTYQICEVLNPTNCDTAIIIITVNPAQIIANDDTVVNPIIGATGQNAVINIYTNDTLNGNTVIPANVNYTVVTPFSNPNITVATNGNVNVAPNTPAGTYTSTYQICEILNPTNCDTAIISLVVEASSIIANDDTPATTVNGLTGQNNVINIYSNDTLNGNTVLPANVNYTVITPFSTPNITVAANGNVNVAPNTPEGVYTSTYQICEALNPTNCDTAIITITVKPAQIIANDDIPANPVNGLTGQNNVINIYTNDTLNGISFPTSAIIYSVVTPFSTTNIIVNAAGNINVAPNTPAGTYTSNYQICEVLNPTNCDTAIITITVNPAPIVANDDTPANTVNSVSGQNNVINIYTNDTLNGVSFVPSAIIYTVVSPFSTTNITVATNGNVSVAPNTPAGTYTSTYQICEVLNPTNCDTAIITIVVEASSIIANDDSPANPINGTDGATNVLNVFTNDILNGNNVNPVDVLLTELNPNPNDPLTLNPNGTIDVAPNSPAGTYTLTYQICEVLNPTNCDTATVTVIIRVYSVYAKVMLQGSLFGTTDGIMRDQLRTSNVIPFTEPYTAYGTSGNTRFLRPDFTTNEQTNSTVLNVTGNDAIVDWVFVELRDPANSSIVLHTKSALIQKDGDVVDSTDGVSPIRFSGIDKSSYFVSIKHRNHIGVMSNTPVNFVGDDITFDFTTSSPNALWNETATFQGFEQMLDVSGKYALWAGNTNSDRKVKYSGTFNDQSVIFSTVINHIANSFNNYNFDFVLPVYSNGDVNMDAKVKYRGVLNDSNYIFFNVITKYLLNASDLYNYDLFKEQTPN